MRKAFAVFIWITVTTLVYGQLPNSTMNGRVTDLQGARIVSARVSVTNRARGTSRETLTNAEGLYVFPALEVGTYDLKVESPSFAVTETHNIILEAGKTQTIDISLHPASANTVINVSGVNDTVNLSQSMIQGQITSKTIESIPLNGRNFLELAYLVPGNRPAPTFDPTKTNTLEVSSAGGFGIMAAANRTSRAVKKQFDRHATLLLACSVLAAGCDVAPKYAKPPVDSPAAYKELTPENFKEVDGWKVAAHMPV